MAKEEQELQLNEQYSRRNTLIAKMLDVLPAVVDYVTGLSGFKSKYGAEAAAYAEAKADLQETEEETAILRTDWAFRIGEWVDKDEEILHAGKVYTVLQGHVLQADWEPGYVPALYRLKGEEPGPEPGDEWPEFIQPTGAHDTYKKGDKVTYKGQHYISLIDNNSWSPEAYPQGWELQND